jgi:hypothetical protein
VAYSSDESGIPEIYVQPYPPGVRHLVSKGGGLEPRWRSDGKELFYIDPANTLMSMEMKTTPGFEAGVPRKLFITHIYRSFVTTSTFHYAVAPMESGFWSLPRLRRRSRPPITVVLNWRGK